MSIKVGIIMGSQSDWETMQHTSATLDALGVHHETRVVSAHRTPDLLFEYAESALDRGLKVIIAGAGGAARSMESTSATRNARAGAGPAPASQASASRLTGLAG